MSSPFLQCIRRHIPSNVSGRVVGTAATISAQTQLLCWSRATLCTAWWVKEATVSREGLRQCGIQFAALSFQILGAPGDLWPLSGGSSTVQHLLSRGRVCSILPDPGWHLVKHRVEGSGTSCQDGGYPGKAPQCFSSFWTGEPVSGCVPGGKQLGWGGTSPLLMHGWGAGGLWGETTRRDILTTNSWLGFENPRMSCLHHGPFLCFVHIPARLLGERGRSERRLLVGGSHPRSELRWGRGWFQVHSGCSGPTCIPAGRLESWWA